MLQIKIENGAAVVSRFQKLAPAMRAELGQGIKEASEFLASDVSVHTPRRTGTAARNVVAWQRKEGEAVTAGTVQYRYGKKGGGSGDAFYMRWVLDGAGPHKIERRIARKLGYSGIRAMRAAAREQAAREGASFRGGIRLKARRALRFTFHSGVGGTAVYALRVNHPGIRKRQILTRRLAANQANLTAILNRHVEAALRKVS